MGTPGTSGQPAGGGGSFKWGHLGPTGSQRSEALCWPESVGASPHSAANVEMGALFSPWPQVRVRLLRIF